MRYSLLTMAGPRTLMFLTYATRYLLWQALTDAEYIMARLYLLWLYLLWQALTDAEYIMARQPGDSRAQLRVKNINVSS